MNDLRPSNPDEIVVLVAIVVNAMDMEQAQETIMDVLTPALESRGGTLDSWWIAEDERYDRSDCDSAIFVPMGSQHNTRRMLRKGTMS